ncbi:MAG TPA: MotA/TolQ/ExbB proton channel family protein [Bryobacteraceae bacterium]|nr:MotA/TolQ/ExbB proton channel family protein [Bryobacteraceae bacterium]
MPGPLTALLLQQTDIWDLVKQGTPLTYAVLGVLFIFSVFSWTIIFSKWSSFGSARKNNRRFLRAFRKATGLEAVMVASEQFRPSPLVAVFDYGYQEVSRQVKSRGSIANREAISRSLLLGVSDQLSQLEHNLNWLATTASVCPFIGLLGTVIGIIRAFQRLGSAGSTSLTAVGPGISEALIATAVGLFAAIPAAIFYNYFGHAVKEFGTSMDDFSLEFLNMIERSFGD